ncbi:cation channel sperm-associated protein 4 isoform X1 [Lutra lutra]|uniref:cation channel sperm-associated protein 4 isoform X1 n=1 Tax=Lutra lutra TaxID=9657 RepID=UPI001FD07CDE|nr:cation channel sperm-associated protein 4 isoform X1 [Lutra lutra]
MIGNQDNWWQQWTDTNIKPLTVLRAPDEPYTRPEEQVLINRQDIMSTKDAWDIQEFITRMYIQQLLRHPAFQLLLAFLLVVNAITIALRTNSFLGQKHYELFSTIDDIVLTILICEVLLGWLNGFWIFWKIQEQRSADFLQRAGTAGTSSTSLSSLSCSWGCSLMNSMSTLSPIPSGELGTLGKRRAPVWTPGERWGGDHLCPSGQVGGKRGGGAREGPRGTPERLCRRALRLVHVCMAVEPLARIIRVILQSVPDMANIMTLILFFMLVFSVFGVTLFGAFLPMHFQNMQVALYTLFICITQDGWVDIYNNFQMETREYAMEIGGAIYFATFITIGAFIGINLFVVVVTTNLEQMMKAGEQGQLHQINFSEGGKQELDGNNELPVVHCVVARLEMSGVPQEPLSGSHLSNLSENTYDNFCLVLEAIQENLMQYKEIRDELNTIVEEVRSIRFNQEQEEELLHKHLSLNLSVVSGSSLDIRDMTCQQDLITALINREKVQESNTNILLNKHKSSR